MSIIPWDNHLFNFDHLDMDNLCLPTHQLFDLSPSLSSESSPEPLTPLKRPSPPAHHSVMPKKSRPTDRVTSKDFVPPDVSGLSKREARLVKNRAAAFLSRQRKREEFESMEIRVAELEQENARLLAITRSASPEDNTVAENDRLKAELAAAQERERQLCAQLQKAKFSSPTFIKPEPLDTQCSLSASAAAASRPLQSSPHKSPSASFGLMVLLCALPTLLTSSTSPRSKFHPPYSLNPPALYDLLHDCNKSPTSTSFVDLDSSDCARFTSLSSSRRKLEFVDGPLAGLDVSFETSSEDGKIRVRIHSAGADAHTTIPTTFDSLHTPVSPTSALSHSVLSDPFLSANPTSASAFGPWYEDPSLSTWTSSPLSSASQVTSLDDGAFSWGIQNTVMTAPLPVSTDLQHQRRVRIALTSLPAPGGEGGEWEIQLC